MIKKGPKNDKKRVQKMIKKGSKKR